MDRGSGKSLRHTFLAKLGLDEQVGPTVALRSWQIVAGATLLILIPFSLTPTEQGYFYAFSSLIALQVFFELGLNQVILQMVSHEYAHLQSNSGDTAKAAVRARLHSLVRLLRWWYPIAAALFFAAVSAGGLWLFGKRELAFSTWAGPWLLLTLATAVNLRLSVWLTFHEAFGRVAGVARMRLVQAVAGSVLMWVALLLGAGLWAIALLPSLAALHTIRWLGRHGAAVREVLGAADDELPQARISWLSEIFPMQWRIGLSWVSGYLLFQAITPVTFAGLGAVEAGRLGLTLALFSSIVTVGMSWTTAKAPTIARELALNRRAEANALFRSVLVRTVGFTTLLAAMLIALRAALGHFAPQWADRSASLGVFFCLSLVATANSFIFAAATYMRAHKEEPMMPASVVCAVLTLAAIVYGTRFGTLATVALYAAVTTIVALPWTTALVLRFYRRT